MSAQIIAALRKRAAKLERMRGDGKWVFDFTGEEVEIPEKSANFLRAVIAAEFRAVADEAEWGS